MIAPVASSGACGLLIHCMIVLPYIFNLYFVMFRLVCTDGVWQWLKNEVSYQLVLFLVEYQNSVCNFGQDLFFGVLPFQFLQVGLFI